MAAILDKAKTKTTGGQSGGRPPAAVEVSPEGVLAAAQTGAGNTPTYAYVAMPPGALTPGIEGTNVHAPDVVAAAIRATLNELSPSKRSITLVLPDTVVRVFVLDFDAFPAKAAEALPVLRFRLRKMVPFDVEHAGVSYQILSQGQNNEFRVLAAILPGPILAEYEAAVRGAGYEPGAVLPASLAALETVDSLDAVLIANLSRQAITTTVASGEDLLLYRTLDLPEDPGLRIEEIQRGIAVAAAYFEDKLQARPGRLYYTGDAPIREFAAWVNDAELPIVELIAQPRSGAMTALGNASIAGVTGALALHQRVGQGEGVAR
jgi:type IV pilus assembly protein PilM